jgi:hypothetical protein
MVSAGACKRHKTGTGARFLVRHPAKAGIGTFVFASCRRSHRFVAGSPPEAGIARRLGQPSMADSPPAHVPVRCGQSPLRAAPFAVCVLRLRRAKAALAFVSVDEAGTFTREGRRTAGGMHRARRAPASSPARQRPRPVECSSASGCARTPVGAERTSRRRGIPPAGRWPQHEAIAFRTFEADRSLRLSRETAIRPVWP